MMTLCYDIEDRTVIEGGARSFGEASQRYLDRCVGVMSSWGGAIISLGFTNPVTQGLVRVSQNELIEEFDIPQYATIARDLIQLEDGPSTNPLTRTHKINDHDSRLKIASDYYDLSIPDMLGLTVTMLPIIRKELKNPDVIYVIGNYDIADSWQQINID